MEELLSELLLYSLTNPRKTAVVIAPTDRKARAIFALVKDTIEGLDVLKSEVEKIGDKIVIFNNLSDICFTSINHYANVYRMYIDMDYVVCSKNVPQEYRTEHELCPRLRPGGTCVFTDLL